MTEEQLRVILSKHRRWFKGEPGGERADLSGAYLREADLRGADLSGANLRMTTLLGAYLSKADLHEADLWGANLWGADLRGADLRGADLSKADLSGTDFTGANLTGTILDPSNVPNGQVDGFQREGDYCVGYRTRRSQVVEDHEYTPGQTYTAPVFSTCPDTVCHPGLYVCATLKEVKKEYPRKEYVRVLFLPHEAHTVGRKTRCKAFYKVKAIPLL